MVLWLNKNKLGRVWRRKSFLQCKCIYLAIYNIIYCIYIYYIHRICSQLPTSQLCRCWCSTCFSVFLGDDETNLMWRLWDGYIELNHQRVCFVFVGALISFWMFSLESPPKTYTSLWYPFWCVTDLFVSKRRVALGFPSVSKPLEFDQSL